MAFTVETGEGLEDATSFVSVQFFRDYCSDRGRDISSYTEEQIEAALIRASFYLSESFQYVGIRKNGRNDSDHYQSLAWPRYGAYDREGAYVDDDSVPREIKWATAEVAYYELRNPEAFAPSYVSHDRVKKERAGPVSIEYSLSNTSAQGARPVLLMVLDLISEFLKTGTGNPLVGQSVRM